MNFLTENSLRPVSEEVRLTRMTRGNNLIKHRHHHHDMYRNASLGAAAPAFCVNSRRFVYKAELLRIIHHWRRIGELWLRLLCIFCCVNGTCDAAL